MLIFLWSCCCLFPRVQLLEYAKCNTSVQVNPGCPLQYVSLLKANRQIIQITKQCCANDRERLVVIVSLFDTLAIHSFWIDTENAIIIDWEVLANFTDEQLQVNNSHVITTKNKIIDKDKLFSIGLQSVQLRSSALKKMTMNDHDRLWDISKGIASDDYVVRFSSKLLSNGSGGDSMINVYLRDSPENRDSKYPRLPLPDSCLLLDIAIDSGSGSNEHQLHSFQLLIESNNNGSNVQEHRYFNDEHMPGVFRSFVFTDVAAINSSSSSAYTPVIAWRPIYFLEADRRVTRWCSSKSNISDNANQTIALSPTTSPCIKKIEFGLDESDCSSSQYFVWTCTIGFESLKSNVLFVREELSAWMIGRMIVLITVPILAIVSVNVIFKLKQQNDQSPQERTPLLTN